MVNLPIFVANLLLDCVALGVHGGGGGVGGVGGVGGARGLAQRTVGALGLAQLLHIIVPTLGRVD